MTTAVLALLFALDGASAAKPGDVAIVSERQRFAAELPPGWTRASEDGSFRPIKSEKRSGIAVRYRDGSMDQRLTEVAKPGPAAAKRLRYHAFHAAKLKSRGRWTLVELGRLRDDNEVHERELVAFRSARGGYYEAALFGEGDEFDRFRPAFLYLLDSFRRAAPAVAFAPRGDFEGNWKAEAPAEPWRQSSDLSAGEIRWTGPDGPGDELGPTFSLRRLDAGKPYADAAAFLAAEARTGAGRTAGKISRTTLPAGKASVVTIDREVAMAQFPEAAGLPARRLRSQWVVLQRKAGFYLLSYTASPAGWDDFLPAWKRFLLSVRLLKD